MKNILGMINIIALVFFAFACNNDTKTVEEGISISGKVNYPQEGLVLLEEIESGSLTVIDTVMINEDSTFQTTLALSEPGFFRLSFYNNQSVNLVLTDEDVHVVVDGNKQNGLAEVTGSTDTNYLTELNEINKAFKLKTDELNQQAMNARGDDAKMQELQDQYLVLQKENASNVKGKIKEMGTSLVSLIAANSLSPDNDFTFLDNLAREFEVDLPNSKHASQFIAQFANLRKVQIGNMAPDIEMANPDGEMVKLSSLRGKYVMIDFWAAWCRPCRAENPNVVRMYHKYNEKGFEVFGVSLDRKKEDWVKAIEKDGLVWTQVSDLQYFNSAAAKLYNVNAIPATFLVGPEGKIIAKNLRGDALEDKLKEILG